MDGAVMTTGERFALAVREFAEAAHSKKQADLFSAANTLIRQKYDILRVNATDSYYYKSVGEYTYQKLDDRRLHNMVRDVFLWGKVAFTPRVLKDTMSMVQTMTIEEIDQIDKNWIEISPHIFWSRKDGKTYDKPDGPCFNKLFNTKYTDKHVVSVPTFTEEQEEELKENYDKALEQLRNRAGSLDEDFDFIKVWADGKHDVYMDIIRSIGYCFLKKQPVGSYILVGLRRNGKSTFVGMLHTIFGRENTSMVRLSQLGDPHYVNTLGNTIMNAPDEEDEGAVEAAANFKTIADHGLLQLSKMASNEPIKVACDFMSFYPMNHMPDWKGTGAAACMKRSLVIPFYADLSKYDTQSDNFAESTFTSDTMCKLIGQVLAIATYYSSNELDFSPTMMSEQYAMEEEAESGIQYRQEFEKFFDGFQSIKLLFTDYVNWCQKNDLAPSKMKHFKFIFRDYTTVGVKSERIDDKIEKFYRIPKGKNLMLESNYYEELKMSLVGMHESGHSVVESLGLYFEGYRDGGIFGR